MNVTDWNLALIIFPAAFSSVPLFLWNKNLLMKRVFKMKILA